MAAEEQKLTLFPHVLDRQTQSLPGLMSLSDYSSYLAQVFSFNYDPPQDLYEYQLGWFDESWQYLGLRDTYAQRFIMVRRN